MLRTAIAGFVGVLVGAAVVGVGCGQKEQSAGDAANANVVRAEKFEVVDSGGRMLAVWSSAAPGGCGLFFYDGTGKKRAQLAVLADGSPSLSVSDKDGETRAALMVMPDGSPILALYDEDGQRRATLMVLPDGGPSLSVLDKDGQTRATLGATSTETIATGVVHQRPESSLVLFDKDSKVLWEAP